MMTTEIPEGRQVLAQRRMSGRVAKIFTSGRSQYPQVGRFCAHIIRIMTVFGDYCSLPSCTNSNAASYMGLILAFKPARHSMAQQGTSSRLLLQRLNSVAT